jgi:hypothetical protein
MNGMCPQIIKNLGDMVQGAGITDSASFQAGLRDYNLNVATRVSWKYGCSRGVYGTPTYHVNGVVINHDPSWTLAYVFISYHPPLCYLCII